MFKKINDFNTIWQKGWDTYSVDVLDFCVTVGKLSHQGELSER